MKQGTSVKAVAITCLALGGAVGFAAGVLAVKEGRSFAESLFRSERKATASSPTTVERPRFRFEHAGNWKLDVADKDYDPDHSFSVETPGQSFVMIQVADAEMVPKDVLETHASLQISKVMKQATRTPFRRWGAYDGEGVLLKGKHLGLTAGTIRIFVFRAGEQTYTIIESTYDEDRADVQPGFDLIERTFKVRAP